MPVSNRSPEQPFLNTSGETSPVWVHQMPYSKYPHFPRLDHDIDDTDVCIIGSGIAGISTAYEMITRGKKVAMLEARNVISGESGRTSGHLSNALDDRYIKIQEKHGRERARLAADSHTWAIDRVADIVKKLDIDCEFRYLPAYIVSQFPRDGPDALRHHDQDVSMLRSEAQLAHELGLDATFRHRYAVEGWDSDGPDQRDAAVFAGQATFHPTKYFIGVLAWLAAHPKFQCYTHSRMVSIEDGEEGVRVQTRDGRSVHCGAAIMATCVPIRKLSLIAEMEYMRTYCIAIRIPKGSLEDCLLYDTADAYKYVRLTACDEQDDYLIVGGCDHKVGQEQTGGRFEELEAWARERFPRAGNTDYKWSGQVFEPVDHVAFIGKNQGSKSNIYTVTGDSGNGLTHGVLAGKLIADEIEGRENPWAALYNPNRSASVTKALPSMFKHDMQINTQYKRYLQSDIKDMEDLAVGTGGVLNTVSSGGPVAVYKDEAGQVHKYSAICPHMKEVLTWNNTEKSWDCPVHGSRFSCDGVCITGPAKSDLKSVSS